MYVRGCTKFWAMEFSVEIDQRHFSTSSTTLEYPSSVCPLTWKFLYQADLEDFSEGRHRRRYDYQQHPRRYHYL